MEDTFPAAEVRELLAAIRDAIDPPDAATYDGLAARDRLIANRAAFMSGAIAAALESGQLPSARPIRELAAEPLGYQPMPRGDAS